MSSVNFRKLRIEFLNRQQLEIEIDSIKKLIAKLEEENVEKSQLLHELKKELEEKQNLLSQIN